MVPFILLFAVFAGLSLLPLVGLHAPALRTATARMRVALAAMFTLTGVSHFVATESFLLMVPDFLPLRREAIYLSGVAELAGAAGLFVPRLRRAAGLGLAALLVAVVPANINVALNNVQVDLVPSSPVYQWGRLVMQPLLVWLVVWASGLAHRTPRNETAAAAGSRRALPTHLPEWAVDRRHAEPALSGGVRSSAQNDAGGALPVRPR